MSKRVRGIKRQFRFPWRTESQVEREVDDELEFHLAMRAQELERTGQSKEAARREALREFGDFDATRRTLALAGQRGERQMRWRTILEDCWRDIRYGARSLARTPGFTAVAVLVLAVGIGANSAAFSIVNVLLMQPALIADADDVVAVYARSERGWSGFSYPEYVDLRDRNRTFAELAAFTLRDVGLAEGDLTRRVRADFVSANYFRTLGVPLARGREFTPTEETPGGEAPVAIVSHSLWARHGRDPGMLGSVVQINGEPVAIVGIAAERFTGHNSLAPDLWLPLGFLERFGRVPGTGPRLDDRENRGLPTLFGRIDAGFSTSDVAADLDVLAERFRTQYPPTEGQLQRYVATTLPRFSIGNAPDGDEERQFMTVLTTVLTGLSGTVLLIACINLANMLLARGAGRRTEIAIRQALGGGRFRLVRQLLVEGLLLALAGGAAGLLCAYWAVSGLLASMPTEFGIGALHETLDVRPNVFVLVATLVTSLIATLLFGLGPAFRVLGGVAGTLKESAGGHVTTTGGRARALLAPRNVLVVAQVALSLALLTAGGLFVRGTIEAGRATPGFALEPVALAELDPSLLGYDEPRSREVFRQALERARSLPGVESASLASLVPLGSTTSDRWVQAAGSEVTDEPPSAYYYVIADDYFRTLVLPMLAGRSFTAAEGLSGGGYPVAIVDEPLAQQLFGGTAQALGRLLEFPSRLQDTPAPTAQIVGVVAGTRHGMAERGPSPHVYVPFGQTSFEQRSGTAMHLHVRAAGGLEAATLLEPLRNALESVDAALPVLSLQTMVDHRDRGLFMWIVRAGGRIFSMLGALALFLAVVGVYGVKAFLVTRRTREIGVRMALGATPGDIVRQMLRESLGLTIAGLVIGLLLAAATAQLVSALLYGVSPIDPLVLTASAAILAASLLLASYLPTRRATRIDPTTALRHE